jgi:ubiquitin-protein ligase
MSFPLSWEHDPGPEGTPYESGCFMFDFHLHDYPHSPPKARFLTTDSGRVRFNPNLYNCGKVCLSLLGTWSGPGWEPKKSTLLQVLVSIQGLILVPDPYYNEPGFTPGTRIKESENYSTRIRQYTVEHAIYDALRTVLQDSAEKPDPYPEFQQVIFENFRQRSSSILRQLQAWQARDGTIASSVARARAVLELVATHETLPAAQAAYAACADTIAPRREPPPRQARRYEQFFSTANKPPPPASGEASTSPLMTAAPPMAATSAAWASTMSGTHAQMPPPSSATLPPLFGGPVSDPFSSLSTVSGFGDPFNDTWSDSLGNPFGPSMHGPHRGRQTARKANSYARSRSSRDSQPGATGFSFGAATDSTTTTSPFTFRGPAAGPTSGASGSVNPVAPAGRSVIEAAAPKAPPASSAGASHGVSLSCIEPSSSAAASPSTGPATRVTGALSAFTKRARRGSNAPPASSPGSAKADPRDVIVID